MVLLLLLAVVAAQARFPTMPSTHGRMPCGSCAAPASISSTATIAVPSESGERMVITGTVYEPDGTTPAAGVILFLYHTDSSGHYNAADDPFDPRIRGWVRADALGRYQFETIKPGAYPSHSEPAHIHVHVYGPKRPEWFIPEYLFAGDPLLSDQDRTAPRRLGSFSNVVTLTKGSDSKLRGTRDIRLWFVRSE